MARLKYPKVTRAQAPFYGLLATFYQYRPLEKRRLGYQFLSVIPFFAGMGALALAMRLFPTVAGARLATVAFLLIGLGIAGASWVGYALNLRFRRELQALDEDQMGPVHPEEDYVGIAYSDGIWVIHEEDSWDWGFMRVVEGRIEYRGRQTSFTLPAHRIRAVRLAAPADLFRVNVPRVYVDWLHPQSGLNTFSLEVARTESADRIRARTEALAAKIRTAPREVRRHLSQDWNEPFQSKWLNFARDPSQQVTQADRLIGLLAAFGTGAVLYGLIAGVTSLFGGEPPGWTGGLIAPFAIVGFNAAVVVRVRRRAPAPAPSISRSRPSRVGRGAGRSTRGCSLSSRPRRGRRRHSPGCKFGPWT